MDVEKRSIGATVRSIIVFVWVIFSTLVYGSLSIFWAPINKRICFFFSDIWIRHLLFFAGITVEVSGTERIDPLKRYVFVANHQSHIDIPVLFKALDRRLSFIAKKELFQIPVFGWSLFALGHIWIDRTNARKAHASINRAIQHLGKENTSLVLFPEGTRSSDGSIGQLKQGSFSLVQKAGFEVVPIVIHDSIHILKKYSLRINSGTVHVTIGTPFTVDPNWSKAEVARYVQGIMENTIKKSG